MEGNQHQQRGPEAAADLSLAERRARVAAAREALAWLGAALWQAPSGGGADGLSGLLGEVDALGAACDAARVAVTREA
ncbi:MAG TPA: hypothetical protein VH915_14315, partial [Pedococcus sp.]